MTTESSKTTMVDLQHLQFLLKVQKITSHKNQINLVHQACKNQI